MSTAEQLTSWARQQRNAFQFNGRNLGPATNCYVAWIDLMGAGHLMSTSIQKSANFLARLHMIVESAKSDGHFTGETVAINDGIYLISPSLDEIEATLSIAIARHAGFFIDTPRPQDRPLIRAGLAFGPVYNAKNLHNGTGARKTKRLPSLYSNVAFGPPIIQAYKSESKAPPYGVAIHESARSFSEPGKQPFRMTHWLWWTANGAVIRNGKLPALSSLKDELSKRLEDHFKWMKSTRLFHELPAEKISEWESMCSQYFSLA